MAVPNEQIKQKSNFESSAKLRLMTSKSTLLRDEIYPDMEASSITVFSIAQQHIHRVQADKSYIDLSGPAQQSLADGL